MNVLVRVTTSTTKDRLQRYRQSIPGVWPDERAAGNRLRVALTGLTMAEKFRDEVVTFCCSLTTSIVTPWPVRSIRTAGPYAFSGRLSADPGGEMGVLQERITSTKTGSITSDRRYTYLRMT